MSAAPAEATQVNSKLKLMICDDSNIIRRKIERELGWRPRESFDTGMRKTIDWYLKNEDWVKEVTSGSYRKWIATQYS